MEKTIFLLLIALNTVISVNAQSWQQVGSSINAQTSNDIRKAPQMYYDNTNDAFYIAYYDEKVAVKTFDGTNWQEVGGPFISTDCDDAMDIRLIGSGFNLYVVYHDGFSGYRIYKFDGSSWIELGASINSDMPIEITYNEILQKLLIAYKDASLNELSVYQWNNGTTSWDQFGGGAVWTDYSTDKFNFTSVGDYTIISSVDGSTVYTKYSGGTSWDDLSNLTLPMPNGDGRFKMKQVASGFDVELAFELANSDFVVYQYDSGNGAWEQIGSTFQSSFQGNFDFTPKNGSIKSAVFNNNGGFYAKSFDGTSWTTTGANPFLTKNGYVGNICYSNSTPFVSLLNTDDNQVQLWKYDNNTGVNSVIENIYSIYPNPTNGIISLDFAENNIERLIISDIAGKLIIEKAQIQQNEIIDLSDFESGIYIITLQTDKEIFTTKIVKE